MTSILSTPLSYRLHRQSVSRHLHSVLLYGSFRKYVNLVKAYVAYLHGSTKISSMPAFLKVEICRYCEVNCLYCYPIRENSPYPQESLLYPLESYKQLVDQFKDSIFLISLYDIGEPLHNPQVLDYIHYAHQHRVGTAISSSLSVEREDRFWRDLVTSGLDHLVVAIDGTSQEVYNRYRRNGQFDLVMSNLKKLLAFKKETNSRLFIEWQMIDFTWNRSEQREAEKMAYQLGCNLFRLIPDLSVPHYGRRPSRRESLAVGTTSPLTEKSAIRDRNCVLAYILFFVTYHNDVRLCYKVYHHDMRIGNLTDNSFSDIWNGNEIARVRDPKQICAREGCRTCWE
jgi:radical SAM protein with 4Fe4S-binding SPASM domain